MKIKKIIKKSYILVGVAIFFLLVKDIDLNRFKEVISGTNILYYSIASILYLPITFLKSYRWKKIMEVQQINYGTSDAFHMYGASTLLGLATPGKLGDFSKIAYLKKDNHSFGKAFLGSMLDKIFDLAFVIVFSIVLYLFFPLPLVIAVNYKKIILWGIAAVLVAGALVALLYAKKKEMMKNFISEIIYDLKSFSIGSSAIIFSITAIAWMIYFAMMYLIAMSIGFDKNAGFMHISFAVALALMSSLIPISMIGIGTRDAVFFFLFLPMGITKEAIIAFSFLIIINYLALFVVSFYCWLKKPVI
jgi:uncharacterized membrane protein YbhN (UPF0104 family)